MRTKFNWRKQQIDLVKRKISFPNFQNVRFFLRTYANDDDRRRQSTRED